MWKHYYPNTDGLIYVVDSSDRNRISLAKEELHKILGEEELKNTVLLVLANKQDIAVMDISEIIKELDL